MRPNLTNVDPQIKGDCWIDPIPRIVFSAPGIPFLIKGSELTKATCGVIGFPPLQRPGEEVLR